MKLASSNPTWPRKPISSAKLSLHRVYLFCESITREYSAKEIRVPRAKEKLNKRVHRVVRRGTTIAIMPGHARSSLSHRVGSIAFYGLGPASCTRVIQPRRREENAIKREKERERAGYLLNYVRCNGRGLLSLHKTRRGASRHHELQHIEIPWCSASPTLDSPGILWDQAPARESILWSSILTNGARCVAIKFKTARGSSWLWENCSEIG